MKASEKTTEKPTEKVVDIFEKIRIARGLDKKQFAKFIGVPSSTLSSSLGKEWDSHWRIFFKLLPDLCALDIIKEPDLQGPVPYEPLTNSRGSNAAKDQDGRKKAGPR